MSFLSEVISLKKENPYEIKILSRGENEILRTFKVDGTLSFFQEKAVSGMGEIFKEENYQFITYEKIEKNLSAEELAEYRRENIELYLVDNFGRLIKLTPTFDYRAVGGILSEFQNVVYKGRVEVAVLEEM